MLLMTKIKYLITHTVMSVVTWSLGLYRVCGLTSALTRGLRYETTTTSTSSTVNFAYNDTRRGIRKDTSVLIREVLL